MGHPAPSNMHRSISAGVETTPSSSIIRASSAKAFSARMRTSSELEALLPFSTKAKASGFGASFPDSSLM